MNLQVLIASLNNDNTLHTRMNIQTDAIICNQCDIDNHVRIVENMNKIDYYNFSDRGVGKNRNNAILRASAEICIIGDDDVYYYENYKEKILVAFEENKNLDLLIFNIDEEDPKRYLIKNKHRVRFYNYMRYGATRIAFRRKSITKNNIFFNIHFGGGSEYSAGEDVLFLTECLKKKLVIEAHPITIGKLCSNRESTWFNGYNIKYFHDKGKLFYYISKKFYIPLIFQFVVRKKFNEFKSIEILKIMLKSANQERENQ